MAKSWRVFKFGGSSVADAACMRRVAEIIESEPAGPLAVVLSACKGVTDELLDLVSAAERQEPTAAALAAVRQLHIGIAGEMCTADDLSAFTSELDADVADISAGCARRPRPSRPRRRRATWWPGTASCGPRGSSPTACTREGGAGP